MLGTGIWEGNDLRCVLLLHEKMLEIQFQEGTNSRQFVSYIFSEFSEQARADHRGLRCVRESPPW